MEHYEIFWDTGTTFGMIFGSSEDAEDFLRETCGAPDNLSGCELEAFSGAEIRLVGDADEGEDDDDDVQAMADAWAACQDDRGPGAGTCWRMP